MLEARVKEWRNQAHMDSTYNESLTARLAHFSRKEAAEMESAKKVAAEEDDDDEEDQHALPSGSSGDDGPVSPIRFSRVMRWLKCFICLNYLCENKNGLLFHIESFIKDEMSPPTWSNNISIFLGCSISNHE
jgi:hypothetical protein